MRPKRQKQYKMDYFFFFFKFRCVLNQENEEKVNISFHNNRRQQDSNLRPQRGTDF